MKCKDFLRIRTTPKDTDIENFTLIESQAKDSFTSMEKAHEYVSDIMEVFHAALQKDATIFLKNILFEHQVTLRKTEDHENAISADYAEARQMENGIPKQQKLVQIYRRLISDVFDPYLTIIVACLQLADDKFESYLLSNLGAGEFNKYEYALSKMKPTNLFEGYDPIIRNSSSHTGSDGIAYQDGHIIFRSIKRGQDIKVQATKLTTAALMAKINALYDFREAVVAAINIIGIDAYDIITEDEELKRTFIDILTTKEFREHLRRNTDDRINNIWNDSSLSDESKLELISKMFFMECGNRNLAVSGIGYNKTQKLLQINLPGLLTNPEGETAIRDQVVTMLRFGIIAEPLFRQIADRYNTVITGPDGFRLTVLSNGQSYLEYAEELAGIYDLLVEAEVYLNGEKLDIQVDFAQLDELELTTLGRKFPRKRRGGSN